jgi:hypothetical protein
MKFSNSNRLKSSSKIFLEMTAKMMMMMRERERKRERKIKYNELE